MYLLNTVLAITLMGLVATSYITYSKPERKVSSAIREVADNGFQAFQKSMNTYREQNIQYVWEEDCPPDVLSGDPSCAWDRKIDTTASLPINSTNWQSEFIPDYMSKIPAMPDNYSWSFGENTNGFYICLTGQNKTHNKYAYTGLLNQYSGGSMKINSTCGATTSWNKETIESSTTSTLSATLTL